MYFKNGLHVQNRTSAPNNHYARKIIVFLLLITAVLMVIPIIALETYFPHADCKIDVSFWYRGEFWNMMDYVKQYDPSAYSLICENINQVSFENYLPKNAAGVFIWRLMPGRDRPETEIVILKKNWAYYSKAPFTERSNIFIHEVCHATIADIMGVISEKDGCDVEYPCYLRGALLKYKFGYYNDAADPYQSMLNEKRVCGKEKDVMAADCTRTSIEIKEASEGKVIVENIGAKQLHCMMFELSINGVLHPVDCDYIQPGATEVISNNYLTTDAEATLRIFGCNDKIDINEFY